MAPAAPKKPLETQARPGGAYELDDFFGGQSLAFGPDLVVSFWRATLLPRASATPSAIQWFAPDKGHQL
jgi:hypothetical protein